MFLLPYLLPRFGWLPTVVLGCWSFLFLSTTTSWAQAPTPAPDTLAVDQKRRRQQFLATGFVVGYTVSLKLLSDAWYRQYPRTRFHLYNDNRHWQQMDKAGHFWTAFHESHLGVHALRWAGTPEKKAIWYGSLLGVILQTPIELMDGYSEEYGASLGDIAANTAGSAALLGQQLAWGEVRLLPKFSFHQTTYPTQRLDNLGNSYVGQLLKDYNGQTYWLSVDVYRFLPKRTRYPRWLNVAVGYGAEGMVAGAPEANKALGFQPIRRFYLSPDLNLRNIPTRSKLLKTVFNIVSIFRLPAPAVQYTKKSGLRVLPLFY